MADGHFPDLDNGCHSYYTCVEGVFVGHNFCPAGEMDVCVCTCVCMCVCVRVCVCEILRVCVCVGCVVCV